MQAHRRTAVIGILLGVGLGAFVVTAPSDGWRELAALFVRIALWGSVLLASAEIGGSLVGSRLTGIAHLVWDGAAGLAVVIGIVLWFGAVPGLYRPKPLLLLVLGLSALAMVLRHWRRMQPREVTGRWPLAGLALLVAVASAGLIWDRVPPVFFDTLTYHFANPALWLIEGRAQPYEWSLHSWFPPGASLMYGIGLAVGGDTAANDFNLLAALLLIGLAVELGRRLFGDPEGVLAGLMLATMPIVVHAVGIPAADLVHGAFGFGALASWLLAREVPGEERISWRRRAALLVAGALLTKYLGVLVPLAVLSVLVVADEWRAGSGFRIIARRAATLALPGLVLLGPWLIGNLRVAGSPVAPTFAAAALRDGGAGEFRTAARGGPPGWSDVRALGPQLVTGDPEARFYPQPAWGWLPVVLLPATLMWGLADRRVRWLLALALATSGIWFLTFRWERFLIAPTALLVTGLAGALPTLSRRGPLQRGFLVLAALVLALGLVSALYSVDRFTDGSAVALGRERSGEFLARIPYEVVYREASLRLDPRTARVLVLGEHRHHRLALPHAAPGAFNRVPGVADLTGFTHLVVDSRRALPADGPSNLAALLDSLGSPLLEHGGVALYALR